MFLLSQVQVTMYNKLVQNVNDFALYILTKVTIIIIS